MFLVEMKENLRGRDYLTQLNFIHSERKRQSKKGKTLTYSVNRLDAQHTFFVDVTEGSLIHSSIKQDGFSAIADIATGTG